MPEDKLLAAPTGRELIAVAPPPIREEPEAEREVDADAARAEVIDRLMHAWQGPLHLFPVAGRAADTPSSIGGSTWRTRRASRRP